MLSLSLSKKATKTDTTKDCPWAGEFHSSGHFEQRQLNAINKRREGPLINLHFVILKIVGWLLVVGFVPDVLLFMENCWDVLLKYLLFFFCRKKLKNLGIILQKSLPIMMIMLKSRRKSIFKNLMFLRHR